MKLPHEKFCVLPWISLETSPIGTVRPCCLADYEIVDNTGVKCDLKYNSLDSIHKGEYMQGLRKDFVDGIQPATCRKCWDTESAGLTSKRMHTLDRLKEILVDEVEWTEDAKDLMFVDFKLGNICNLKCRICGSWSSSTFAAEEIKELPKAEQKSSFPYAMLKAGAWPRQNEKFWDDLKVVSEGLRYVEFTGGEPFMIQEHFDYLQSLVDQNLAHQIEIHYNTNGTQWPEESVHLWSHFKHVEIAFSIDNVDKRFEYERTNADWKTVNQNIQRFIDLRAANNNISLQLCTTVNIFNVLYLEDVVNWKHFGDFDFVYWNILHDGPQFCIQALPENAKQLAAEKLHSTTVPQQVQDQWRDIVTFMQGSNGTTTDQVKQEITRVDQRRGVDLRNSHPELWELIFAN